MLVILAGVPSTTKPQTTQAYKPPSPALANANRRDNIHVRLIVLQTNNNANVRNCTEVALDRRRELANGILSLVCQFFVCLVSVAIQVD